jgi:hypothetical protein
MKRLLCAALVIIALIAVAMAHPASSGTAYTALITLLQLKSENMGRNSPKSW